MMRVNFHRIDEPNTYGYVADVGNGRTVEFIRHYAGEWNTYVKVDGVTQYWRTVVNSLSEVELQDAFREHDIPYARARSIATQIAHYYAGQVSKS